MNLLNHKTGRGLVTFAFYFAEGAPIGFIWWAMPTLLRKHNVDIGIIGALTAVLTLPWVFKFLWAPMVDIFRTPRFGFTKWILVSQLLMCLTLAPLIFIPLSENIIYWGVLLLLHSICAATQDVSIDAMVINLVVQKERGTLNGCMQAGMLLGRSLFGGGALFFVPRFGLPIVITAMIAVILCVLILLVFIREPAVDLKRQERFDGFKETLQIILRSKQTWFTLAFALTGAAAFEISGAMLGPFLTDKEFNVQVIGFFFGVPAVISMLLGGVVGGYISDKISRKLSVAFFLGGIILVVGTISGVELMGISVPKIMWILFFSVMYFFTGMFTSSSYALFMDMTNPKLGATQFSAFMAATNGCEAWVVWSGGLIVSTYSYSIAFSLMCLVSLLSMVFLSRLRIA